MRVAILSAHYPPFKGLSHHTRALAHAMASLGTDVSVFTARHPTRTHPFLDARDGDTCVKVYPVWWVNRENTGIGQLSFAWSVLATLKRVHNRSPFDIVHSLHTFGVGFSRVRRLFEGLPYVPKANSTWMGELAAQKELDSTLRLGHVATKVLFPIAARLEKQMLRSGDRVIAISKSIKRELISYYGIDANIVRIVHNGVETATFSGEAVERLDDDNRQTSRLKILFVGRLFPRKGIQYLLEAMAQARKKLRLEAAATTANPALNLTLSIVGDGPMLNELQRLAFSLGIQDCVQFRGRVPITELPRTYAESDILAVPSTYEPFGLVVAEAMASGLPVIASAVGGIPEFVESGRTGILVPPADVSALSDALCEMATDFALRRKLSANARSYACRNLDWKVTAKKTLNVFDEVA